MTLTPWDLRVQLPREARDKTVVLPAYLQHPILFGLRGEYQAFQSHHPETLAFSSSSLSSICAGLEVEEVRSSGKVTGGLPFHLQALAPSSPRRALEEALTLTRCLRSLMQKARPSQSNPQGDPDVLARPLDARSDVRAFLGERSKVVHLSGLPHDTTQSELESWFTQYGGRPIAFWTLRTPEGGKPSGSGFVVFGSHEEVSSQSPISPPKCPSLRFRRLLDVSVISCLRGLDVIGHAICLQRFYILLFWLAPSTFNSRIQRRVNLPTTKGQQQLSTSTYRSLLTSLQLQHHKMVLFGAFADKYRLKAAESLSMNGRALNDRAIEVSPSSSRVSRHCQLSQTSD